MFYLILFSLNFILPTTLAGLLSPFGIITNKLSRSIFYISQNIVFLLCPWLGFSQKRLHLDEQCIVMCNHVSNMDPLMVPMIFSWETFISSTVFCKDSLFKLPFFGQILYFSDYLPVYFSRSVKIIMDDVDKRIRKGDTLFLYPEGGRNFTKELILPFKRGGFDIAQKHNLPIYIVAVKNMNIAPNPTCIQYKMVKMEGYDIHTAENIMKELLSSM